jgi:hypothetical protein
MGEFSDATHTLLAVGSDTFGDRELHFEEFNENGTVARYFFDGETLAGRRTTRADDSVADMFMTIGTDVPDYAFDVPPGALTPEEYAALFAESPHGCSDCDDC